jgi:glycosyltransferase involved in cell wall biosynthesis
MKRIAFVVSTPSTAEVFLRGHLAALSKHYEIDLIANFPKGYYSSLAVNNFIHVPVHRNINVWHDLMALIALIKLFLGSKYDAVHSITPKAGLLAMLAAWLTSVPLRHHTFTGQVWATRVGFSRWFLKTLDTQLHRCSTHTLVDSFSQRNFLLDENVIRSRKSSVLASGSISGVNIARFKPDLKMRFSVRELHGVNESDFVFLFLGRINNEKGLPELFSAFKEISERYPAAKLMIVGPDECGLFENGTIEKSFAGNLIRVGFTSQPEEYFNAADVFCLPSHREGFGSVLIEAAACGITSVASNIYGISDAVVDGVTGLLHTPKSVEDLKEKMGFLILSLDLRKQLANCALERARNQFSSAVLERELVAFYVRAFNFKL